MPEKENNYAYIDGQNLNSGVRAMGWKLNHKKFREYLDKEFNVTKAYMFIGFMEEHQDLYNALQEAGFILVFKPLVRYEDGTIKGNVDTDLVLNAMIEIDRFDKAVVVTGDGDFAGFIRHLASVKKLKQVIIPNKRTYSSLFERMDEFGKQYFTYMDDLKKKLIYHDSRRRSRGSKNGSKPKSK